LGCVIVASTETQLFIIYEQPSHQVRISTIWNKEDYETELISYGRDVRIFG